MSSLNRISLGALSGLGKNFTNIFVNIIALPIYLTFWNVELYGAWIIVLTIHSFLKLPALSYQEYLGSEFLKLGKNNKIEISKILYGSIFIIIIYFLVNFFLIYIIFNHTDFILLFSKNNFILEKIKIAILILYGCEILSFVNGVITRALYPFNYYPKLNFLGLIISIIIPLIQILSLSLGFKIIGLCIITAIIVNFFNIILIIYLNQLLIKEKIRFYKYNLIENFKHLKNSTFLILGKTSELFKNEGIRIILVPFLGNFLMVNYSIMKTASNLMRSFFNSILNSLIIEFIDYINQKNKIKFQNTYLIIYFLNCLIITTSVFFLQTIAPPLFEFWTKNKILFDNVLFASFSIAFIIMIFYSPSLMILKGKNLFKEDFTISIITSTIFVFISIISINNIGLRGMGFSLIILEIFSCLLVLYYSFNWLKKNFIQFDYKILGLSFIDIIITSIFIFVLIISDIKQIFVIFTYLLIKILIVKIFWGFFLNHQKKWFFNYKKNDF